VQRRFRVDRPELAERLVAIGDWFLAGYHTALADPRPERLAARVGEAPVGWRGFTWEGVGFGLALLDSLWPRRGRGRLEEILAGAGAPHRYLIVVGSGWSLARLPKRVARHVGRFDPRFGWLALDGYGFHEGYFHHPRRVGRQRVPRRLTGYARRGFDQGLGRSLWFLEGADPERVARTVGGFPERRRGDLWAGVGLACAYAGGIDADALDRLGRLAGDRVGDLAQGVAFAAKSRHAAADPAPHTELACRVLWGGDVASVAATTDEVLAELEGGLPGAGAAREPSGEPIFESWRRGIRERHRAPPPARPANW
jgi:hypothetical protein